MRLQLENQEIARIMSDLAGEAMANASIDFLSNLEKKLKEKLGKENEKSKEISLSAFKNLTPKQRQFFDEKSGEKALKIWKENLDHILINFEFIPKFPCDLEVKGVVFNPEDLHEFIEISPEKKVKVTLNLGVVKVEWTK